MHFEHSRSETTSASPEAVWALWSDPDTWPTWDPSVEAVRLDGAFEAGVAGTMTLGGGIEVPVTVVTVEPRSRFVDRLDMGELSITIDHVVRATDSGAEVTVTTVVTGPGAEDVGPMVSADAPKAMAALVAQAEAG